MVSYYQVNSHLSLVCITHEDVMDKQGALIEYKCVFLALYAIRDADWRVDSVAHLRESISKILDLSARHRRRGSSGVALPG